MLIGVQVLCRKYGGASKVGEVKPNILLYFTVILLYESNQWSPPHMMRNIKNFDKLLKNV